MLKPDILLVHNYDQTEIDVLKVFGYIFDIKSTLELEEIGNDIKQYDIIIFSDAEEALSSMAELRKTFYNFVICKTSLNTEQTGIKLLRRGADYIFDNNSTIAVLPAFITASKRRLSYAKPKEDIVFTEFEQEKSIKLLSPREKELLTLVAKGLRNREISHQLCITVTTVTNHMANIIKKLNVSNRTEAAILYTNIQKQSLTD